MWLFKVCKSCNSHRKLVEYIYIPGLDQLNSEKPLYNYDNLFCHNLWGLLYALYAQTHLNHDSNNTSPNIKIPPICGISQWKICSMLILTFNNTLPESWINNPPPLPPKKRKKRKKERRIKQ